MAKDIKKVLHEIDKLQDLKLPHGHETRFLEKLDMALPQKRKLNFRNIQFAASIILFLGLAYGGFYFFNKKNAQSIVVNGFDTATKNTTGLSTVSPDLKKIEDYYLAAINLELSKVKLTPDNKELFDSYIKRLENLKKEYNQLSIELVHEGPNEFTINALINNLKLRLNLLYRLKNQLKTLKTNKKAEIA